MMVLRNHGLCLTARTVKALSKRKMLQKVYMATTLLMLLTKLHKEHEDLRGLWPLMFQDKKLDSLGKGVLP